ncbi:MAG: response regulator transcription factor [Rubrivivax sp.]|nr:response regulator transcription factor [Rubrivivax sp.]MCL4697251.1 LytTR family DNA-binding domain-containing protein [Burkholderiaceae bacterium]
MTRDPTALVADDEPLLRERLIAHLNHLWPELQIVAQARSGREAVELFDEHTCDVAFLDIHMPGLNGLEAARAIGTRALVVFVTAYEQHAVTAFERGALDYLVKPFDDERLAATVQRLRERLAERTRAVAVPADAAADRVGTLLEQLSARLGQHAPRRHLQWIKASVGPSLRLIPVDEVAFLRSDEKYTLVAWAGGEALIRKTIRELADELDPERFVQVHRSVIVALPHVSHVVRNSNETAEVHLRGRPEVLPVSRSWLHVFRQM